MSTSHETLEELPSEGERLDIEILEDDPMLLPSSKVMLEVDDAFEVPSMRTGTEIDHYKIRGSLEGRESRYGPSSELKIYTREDDAVFEGATVLSVASRDSGFEWTRPTENTEGSDE